MTGLLTSLFFVTLLAGPARVLADGEPDTTIISSPTSISTTNTRTFEFTSTQQPASFECRIDGSPYVSCLSPFSTPPLINGSHTFEVRARNSTPLTDPTPASFTWNIMDAIPINDCDTLQLIGHDVGYPLNIAYELSNDIDCTATSEWNSGLGFDPIGDHDTPFTGLFDGKNHTINGLYINRANDQYGQQEGDENYVGLFGSVENNGAVEKLSLTNAHIKGYENVGGITGFADHATLTNLSVNVGLADNNCNPGNCIWARFGAYGGGIVGKMFHSTMKNVASGGPVKGSGVTIGGIAGMISDSSVVDLASSTSNVDGGINIGGFVGELYNSTITNVEVSGDVRVESDDHKIGNQGGGFAGYVSGSTISGSYASGNVNGMNYLGGFIGWINDNTTTISDSQASGSVQGYNEIGGFIGYSLGAQVTNSSASGVVNSDGNVVGGFVGGSYCGSSYEDSSASGAVSAQGEYVGGFTGSDANECSGSTYTNSFATGNVSGYGEVGGFIGWASNSTLTRTYARGNVNASAWQAGGLIGYSMGYGDFSTNVSQSFAMGNVSTGPDGFNAGGFVGITQGDSNVFTDVFARGSVTGSDIIGGFIGYSSAGTHVLNGYATGQITSGDRIGGFAGAAEGGTNVESSFWDKDTTGTALGGDGTPKSTAEMKNIATFTSLVTTGLTSPWDFVENVNDDNANDQIWQIVPNVNDGYPCLNWAASECTNLLTPTIESSNDLTSAEDGSLVRLDQTGCSVINDSSSIKESQLEAKDPAYEYPVGLVQFNLSGCTVGAQATIDLTFTGDYDLKSFVIRKYNPNTKAFTTLSTANSGLVLTKTTLEGKAALRATYRITDGGALDQDGQPNGEIQDPSGLALQVLGAPNTGIHFEYR